MPLTTSTATLRDGRLIVVLASIFEHVKSEAVGWEA
jgi:hypothetical protein